MALSATTSEHGRSHLLPRVFAPIDLACSDRTVVAEEMQTCRYVCTDSLYNCETAKKLLLLLLGLRLLGRKLELD